MSKKVTFENEKDQLIAGLLAESNMWRAKLTEAENKLKELEMFCLLFVVASFIYFITTTN